MKKLFTVLLLAFGITLGLHAGENPKNKVEEVKKLSTVVYLSPDPHAPDSVQSIVDNLPHEWHCSHGTPYNLGMNPTFYCVKIHCSDVLGNAEAIDEIDCFNLGQFLHSELITTPVPVNIAVTGEGATTFVFTVENTNIVQGDGYRYVVYPGRYAVVEGVMKALLRTE